MKGISPRGSRGDEGFSLIELMVVLVILGLATALVIVSIPSSSRNVFAEAQRLAARTHSARESAVIEARPHALRLARTGYALSRRVGREWHETARFSLPEEVTIANTPDLAIRFEPTGLAQAARVVLEGGGRRVSVVVSPDGTVRVED